MNDLVATQPSGSVAHYKLSDLKPAPFSPRGASTNELMNDDTGARIASGIVYFKDCEIPFTLWYDEVMICHAVEVEFEIIVGDATYPMKPGDMMWLPAGTSLVWRSQGTSTAFFAVTPADWAKRKPQS
jgi:ethanolamine utilization protein EutQ